VFKYEKIKLFSIEMVVLSDFEEKGLWTLGVKRKLETK